MSNTIVFDEITGRITGVSLKKEETPLAQNELRVEGVTPSIGATKYVNAGELIVRPQLPIVILGKRIEGIPPNTTVFIGTTPYMVDDGVLEVSFTYPGTYKVVISKFPYLDYFSEITQ